MSGTTATVRRRPVATVTILADRTGKAVQVVSKSLRRQYAPPGTEIPGIGPLFDEADAVRYLTHQRQGQAVVPPEQYELHRDVREQIVAVWAGHEPATAQALAKALRELRAPWHPAPPGPDDPEGYIALSDAADRAGKGKTTASQRLKDAELRKRFGVHVVQLRSLRVFYPSARVVALLAEDRPSGVHRWPVERSRYVPPARRGAEAELAAAGAAAL